MLKYSFFKLTKFYKIDTSTNNNERPHMSISNLTPNQVHKSTEKLKLNKLWKNYYKKNSILVKQEQDVNQTVNLLQDL